MTNLADIILRRRSTRQYTDAPVPEDQLSMILQAGLLAPTGRNRKPCEFYVVRDRAVLNRLAEAKEAGAGLLASCRIAIAVLADGEKADTWVEDASIALSYMSLAATEQGIGNCWCQMHLRRSHDGEDAETLVRQALHVPEDRMRVVGVLALGMPGEDLPPHTPEEADWRKVHEV